MNRAERRRLERQEQSKTLVGWVRHPSPKELKQGDGWFRELDRVYRDKDSQFVVMIRDVQTEWGIVHHAVIKCSSDDGHPMER